MDRVPELYRLIIDDVLRSIKLSLEQYGWDEETVARKTQNLQQVSGELREMDEKSEEWSDDIEVRCD